MDLRERAVKSGNRHPWELARAEFVRRLILDSTTDRSIRLLDIGAGDAWLGTQPNEYLPGGSTITCWDINYSEDDVAALTSEWPTTEFTADEPTGLFDLVTMFDVLEHIDDDKDFLASVVATHLREDGRAIITVPAYQSLFTDHDVQLDHKRRYSPSACRSLLIASGLQIVSEGGLFSSLLPVRLLQVTVDRARRTSPDDGAIGVGAWQGGKLTTAAIRSALSADFRLSLWASRRGIFVPGLSYWAVCVRAE